MQENCPVVNDEFIEWLWGEEEEDQELTAEQMHPDYEWPQDNS
jgi:hypothetical protein